MKPSSATVSHLNGCVKPGLRAQSQEERKALLDKPLPPTLLETFLYERGPDETLRYTRRLDSKTCYTESELLTYLKSFIATAEEDGWDVCLFVDGKPETRLAGKRGSDPWR